MAVRDPPASLDDPGIHDSSQCETHHGGHGELTPIPGYIYINYTVYIKYNWIYSIDYIPLVINCI